MRRFYVGTAAPGSLLRAKSKGPSSEARGLFPATAAELNTRQRQPHRLTRNPSPKLPPLNKLRKSEKARP